MEELVIESSTGEYTRKTWLLRGPADRLHPLCLFLDAEHYLRDMDSLPLIERMMECGAIPPMTCLFVSHASGAARYNDFTCNDRYSRYIARDVVDRVKTEVPSVREDAHAICGLSLSGLSSAYATLNYPQVFSRSLCQSGSFWWRHEWFAAKARALGQLQAKFWLSVGDAETDVRAPHPPKGFSQEISQISGVEKAVTLIELLGGEVKHHLFSGGHSPVAWREELPEALRWLLQNEDQPGAVNGE